MVLDTDAPDLSTIIYNARTADHTEALADFMEDHMAVATDQVDMAHMGTTNIPGKKGDSGFGVPLFACFRLTYMGFFYAIKLFALCKALSKPLTSLPPAVAKNG